MNKVKFFRGLASFFLILIILLGSAKVTIFSSSFYSNEFVKNNVGVASKEKITSDLLYFLKSKKVDSLYISSFNEVEQEHLFEVRSVMHVFFSIFNLAVFFFIVCLYVLYFLDKSKFFKNIGKSLFYGGISGISVSIIFILFALNFDSAFVIFHNLFFKTQWQFPKEYLLIQLFPLQFFIDAFFRIIWIIISLSLVLGVIGYFVKNKNINTN